MRKPLAIALLSAALCAPLAQTVQASVIISNLDPNNPNIGFNAPTIGQAVQTGNRPITLTSVQFLQTGGQTAGETAAVYSRNADGTVGSPLFSAFTLAYDNTITVTTATPSGGFTLQANTGYYFVLSSGTTSNVEWSRTSSTDYASAFGVTLPAAGDSSFSQVGNSTSYFTLAQGPQQIEVDGAGAVPEPATGTLLGLGGAGLLALGRCRRARTA